MKRRRRRRREERCETKRQVNKGQPKLQLTRENYYSLAHFYTVASEVL